MKSTLRTPSQSINLLPKQRLNLLLLFQFRLKKSNFRSRFVQFSTEPRYFSLQGPALIAGSIAETLIVFFGLRHCNEGVNAVLEIFLESPYLLFLCKIPLTSIFQPLCLGPLFHPRRGFYQKLCSRFAVSLLRTEALYLAIIYPARCRAERRSDDPGALPPRLPRSPFRLFGIVQNCLYLCPRIDFANFRHFRSALKLSISIGRTRSTCRLLRVVTLVVPIDLVHNILTQFVGVAQCFSVVFVVASSSGHLHTNSNSNGRRADDPCRHLLVRISCLIYVNGTV
mmetsp:Transcript_27803/g.65268  ORF Transcript_27803/g.65268 Transcript_27803/m.65268 type:complete len:283 (+) Transcript_27803:102-950(+)